MEKWKIATIAALLVALLGFGIAQQNADKARVRDMATGPKNAAATPTPLPYVGKTLPAWNFKIWNGKPVPLASLQGKPALVEIFRTGCQHCQEAAPFMTALQKRYAPRGLQIVAIQSPADFKDAQDPENQWPAIQNWIKQYQLNYPVAFDEGSRYFQGTLAKKFYGGESGKLLYPTVLLLDKAGKIDFAQTGHDIGKAITLAVELEKRFPTSDSPEKNAADLAPWLEKNLPELRLEGALSKALRDDIAQRLKNESP